MRFNGRFLTKVTLGLAAGALGSALSWGAPTTARPGTVNYVEGQVRLDGQNLGAKSMGTTEVEQGGVLQTAPNGRAEILLTPGAFLRVGGNSAIRMDSPSLSGTRLQLLHGKAMVEVADLGKHSNLLIAENGSVAQIEKNGLYEFNADNGTVQVYDGKVRVEENDKTVDVKKGKEVIVNAPLKAQSFDRKASEDDLYNWSAARSEYMAEASAATANTVVVNSPGWFGTGWYWNPWMTTWSFIPGDGIFYSPFGWGFYSPFYAPVYGYYGGYGYHGWRGGHVYGGTRPALRSGGFSRGVVRGGGFARGGGFPSVRGGVTMPGGRVYSGPMGRFGR